MKQAGRIAAAIEVLREVMERKRPAGDALRDWGKAHRFAGSSDRHAIGTLVYDGLRRRNSSAHGFKDRDARSVILGLLVRHWDMAVETLASLVEEQHGAGALTEAERRAFEIRLEDAEPDVRADFPLWLEDQLRQQFGEDFESEMLALTSRAPIDLRTNTLKTTRDELKDALGRFHPVIGPLSPLSLRIAAPGPEDKHINVEAEPAHGLGHFEVQDSASQIAALMSGVKPGDKVVDLCAGAGGKTLALAALMQNQGKILAHDRDRFRLRPIFERLTRAGITCVDVVGSHEELKINDADVVFVDAPCSGSGAWRRKPESKWKLSQKSFAVRLQEQQDVLTTAAPMVKRGGRLIYVTCSILPSENTAQVKWFLEQNKDFKLLPYPAEWKRLIGGTAPKSADGASDTLTFTPRQHDVDGFFVAVLQKL